QLQLAAKDFPETFGHLLEDHQPVDDRKVPTRRHRIQVIAVVVRFGREVAQVDVGDDLGLFGSRDLEVVSSKPVTPAARPGVRLHKQSLSLFATLQLDEVVASTKRAKL